MSDSFWPLFDLRVTTPRLELRYVDDALGEQLAALAAEGVHDPGTMPFSVPWTDAEPPQLQRNTLQYYWRSRAETSPPSWQLHMAVIVDGEVVGTTALMAHDFPVLRQFETGSWLGRRHQGIGIGKEMRRASLHLGFSGLGAELAATGAFEDNAASLGVTRSLPYVPQGHRRIVRRDQPATLLGFEMSRQQWLDGVAIDDITIHGLQPCLDLLGIT